MLDVIAFRRAKRRIADAINAAFDCIEAMLPEYIEIADEQQQVLYACSECCDIIRLCKQTRQPEHTINNARKNLAGQENRRRCIDRKAQSMKEQIQAAINRDFEHVALLLKRSLRYVRGCRSYSFGDLISECDARFDAINAELPYLLRLQKPKLNP
jgi:hypothetical protein